ncbi:MAG: c-type cytochrome [Methylococcales bacterium]
MKRKLYLALSTLAVAFTLSNVAGASDVFHKNCGTCHAGGKNIMNPDKTLTKESLEKNGVNNLDAIKALVSDGKAPMPAFKSLLDEKQINDVSAFVLEQAEKGWE